MSAAEDKREAKTHLGRARTQGKHAVKNTAKAVQLGAEVAAEETVDALKHTAAEAEHVVEGVAEEVKEHAPRVSARGVQLITGDLGVGFLATSVSIYSGLVAYHAFRRAIASRGVVVR